MKNVIAPLITEIEEMWILFLHADILSFTEVLIILTIITIDLITVEVL